MAEQQQKETASQKYIVNNAEEFYDLARRLSPKISFIFVSQKQIEKGKTMLDDRWKGLKNIPAIQSKHFFQFEEGKSICVARTSKSNLKSKLVLTNATKKKRGKVTKKVTKKLRVSDVYSDSEDEP